MLLLTHSNPSYLMLVPLAAVLLILTMSSIFVGTMAHGSDAEKEDCITFFELDSGAEPS